MQPTAHPRVNALLDDLLARMRGILGDKLVGLYLGGSLAIGDFDPRLSDVDLVAALASDVDDREFDSLREMHHEVAERYPDWEGRIEVRYVPIAALNAVESPASEIVSVSPGEPFHRVGSGVEWLIDWYLVREKSITLFGRSPRSIIEPISKDEFVRSVRSNARAWGTWIDGMRRRKGQAYAILALCRALYACRHGDQVSKLAAAHWAQGELPEWSELIGNAVAWREAPEDEAVDHAATYPETVRFVEFARARIAEG
ncbi:MAG TPA: aminoglycoside adenylyltransferase domain-containing protein [Chloroflexota bacterium]|nr:aminoglycoside adenylyltransferase domain-containing protein [Chloroflexota bacterium]